MTHKERIIALLETAGRPMSDREMADTLNIPLPSVRRERGQLEDKGRIWFDNANTYRRVMQFTTQQTVAADGCSS